jgi:Mg2+/Co2+ transporter CorC
MEKIKIQDLMIPVGKFPKITCTASFYEALSALEKAQNQFLSGESSQRILLVEDEKGKIMGKLSPIDLLRGLETNYTRADTEATLARFRLYNIWKSIQQDYHLWENPFDDLCRKAEEVKIKDFVKGPTEGQSVAMNDSMTKCFHLFVMNRHDALFVFQDNEIAGLLRFSDVFRKVSESMKECQLNSGSKP